MAIVLFSGNIKGQGTKPHSPVGVGTSLRGKGLVDLRGTTFELAFSAAFC